MAIELTSKTRPAVAARTLYSGSDRFNVAAGQLLRIETSPGGAEILDVEVIAGKTWDVVVRVEVIETDV